MVNPTGMGDDNPKIVIGMKLGTNYKQILTQQREASSVDIVMSQKMMSISITVDIVNRYTQGSLQENCIFSTPILSIIDTNEIVKKLSQN